MGPASERNILQLLDAAGCADQELLRLQRQRAQLRGAETATIEEASWAYRELDDARATRCPENPEGYYSEELAPLLYSAQQTEERLTDLEGSASHLQVLIEAAMAEAARAHRVVRVG